MLLTSQKYHSGFDTAIQAGCLIEKDLSPTDLLELVQQRLESTGAARHEQKAMQQLMIRWLKPCSWSIPLVKLNRFWGINE